MKTSELQGAALDWAVAKCEGLYLGDAGYGNTMYYKDGNPYTSLQNYSPSTDWAQGGPIIEREVIRLTPRSPERAARQGAMAWVAGIYDKTSTFSNMCEHPTPLIAAMRCYVASKLGDEVEIPKELK